MEDMHTITERWLDQFEGRERMRPELEEAKKRQLEADKKLTLFSSINRAVHDLIGSMDELFYPVDRQSKKDVITLELQNAKKQIEIALERVDQLWPDEELE